jgi:hypothetical protein
MAVVPVATRVHEVDHVPDPAPDHAQEAEAKVAAEPKAPVKLVKK